MEGEKETFKEFSARLRKLGQPTVYKIGKCLGSRDAWKWIRKNKWKSLNSKPFDQLLYSKIIDEVNKNLVEAVIDGHEIEFPHKMGGIRISSFKGEVHIKDGNLVSTHPIDWVETLKLWYEDEEMREKRIKIRKTDITLFKIEFVKDKTFHPNKQFYLFRPNRSFKNRVAKERNAGTIKTVEFEN